MWVKRFGFRECARGRRLCGRRAGARENAETQAIGGKAARRALGSRARALRGKKRGARVRREAAIDWCGVAKIEWGG